MYTWRAEPEFATCEDIVRFETSDAEWLRYERMGGYDELASIE
jgi:hypothetical protein